MKMYAYVPGATNHMMEVKDFVMTSDGKAPAGIFVQLRDVQHIDEMSSLAQNVAKLREQENHRVRMLQLNLKREVSRIQASATRLSTRLETLGEDIDAGKYDEG